MRFWLQSKSQDRCWVLGIGCWVKTYRPNSVGIAQHPTPITQHPAPKEVCMAIKSFRDLRVWQVGMDLVEQVYLLTQSFPKHEIYGLASQMQRAAVSIPSNIAEGHAREHLKEYLHHLGIAHGS